MIVVDGSALIDALLAVPDTDALRRFLATEELHAPSLIDYEIVSALRGLALGGVITAARAQDVLTDLDDLPLHRWPSSDGLRRRSLHLRDNVSADDAAYVALAEALGCALLTRDGRLSRSSGHHVPIEVL